MRQCAPADLGVKLGQCAHRVGQWAVYQGVVTGGVIMSAVGVLVMVLLLVVV